MRYRHRVAIETDLNGAFAHPLFDKCGYPGTYGSCTASNKADNLLRSPALFVDVQGGGVWRKSQWPGLKPKKWQTYSEFKKLERAASDRAAVRVDLAP